MHHHKLSGTSILPNAVGERNKVMLGQETGGPIEHVPGGIQILQLTNHNPDRVPIKRGLRDQKSPGQLPATLPGRTSTLRRLHS